jgi:hypothetical protein
MHPFASRRAPLRRALLPAVVAALAGGASAAPLAAQGTFEGVITMTVQDPRGTGSGSMQYMLRAGKVRVDFAAARAGVPMTVIVDPGAQKMYMVMAPQRMYVERAISAEQLDRMTGHAKPEITKTGKIETIAGRECEIWTATENGERYDACVAKGLGTFFQGESALLGRGGWLDELRDGAFPLRITRGDGATLLQVTSIERKPLDAALFAVPEGYRKMELPAGVLRRQ